MDDGKHGGLGPVEERLQSLRVSPEARQEAIRHVQLGERLASLFLAVKLRRHPRRGGEERTPGAAGPLEAPAAAIPEFSRERDAVFRL